MNHLLNTDYHKLLFVDQLLKFCVHRVLACCVHFNEGGNKCAPFNQAPYLDNCHYISSSSLPLLEKLPHSKK